MNNRFDFEAFGAQPFSFEEEEELRSARRGKTSPRKPAAARKKVAAGKAGMRGKPHMKKRPRPGIKFPFRFPIPGLALSVWPGLIQEPSKEPPSQEPKRDASGTGPSSASPPPPESDQPRSESEYVRWIQVSLNKVLNLNLSTDGVMNSETRDAIRSFQQREGLPVTGVAGPDTQQALIAATRGPANDKAPEKPPESDQEFFGAWAAPFWGIKGCPTFNPVPVENPGGSRVKNKTAPSPGEIVQVDRAFGGKVPLHRLAAAALSAMQCEAAAAGLKPPLLQPTSGFRDPKKQAELWAIALKKYGSPEEARKWVAPPGGSAHQSGRAIDFYLGGKNSSSNVANLRKLPAYDWLVANARRFGFYPYEREPWHWEYNPPASVQPEILPELYESSEFEEEFEDEGIGPISRKTPQQTTASSATAAAPKLIGQENIPPGQTLYVNIPFGSERPAKPMTGIFIPNNFQLQPQVDLIIYLHGIKTKADLTIDRYWNQKLFPHFALREGLNQSQKNVILVAPTLGPRSQTQTGWLTEPGGFDKFLDQVLAALAAYGPYQRAGQQPRIGNIILACHSGGGLPMRKLALGKNRYASQIKECWGFDCLYFTGDETLWAQWAKSRPDAKLFIHYQSSTRDRSEKLKKKQVPNISVSRSTAKGHNWVPIHHWRERLESASTLQSSPPGSGVRSGADLEWSWGDIWDRFTKLGAVSPSPSTSPSGTTGTYTLPPPYSPLALAIRSNAVAIANQEWNRWNKGSTKETDPKMRPLLEDYWLNGTGSKRTESSWWSAVPWSAAFISWVMKKAGAGSDFKYSGSHSIYTAAAKANALANNNNPFKAYPINQVAPRIGDLVCKSRAGSGATYDNIKPGMATHCDIVTAVQPNSLTSIGGNVSNSVSQTTVKTDANGKITSPGYFAVIRVGA